MSVTVTVGYSREGVHCSHCGWLLKNPSDDPKKDHRPDCPWVRWSAKILREIQEPRLRDPRATTSPWAGAVGLL